MYLAKTGKGTSTCLVEKDLPMKYKTLFDFSLNVETTIVYRIIYGPS